MSNGIAPTRAYSRGSRARAPPGRVALCTICHHPERSAIDRAIVSGGEANRIIASRYGLSKDAVRRHSLVHVRPALARVAAQRSDRRAVSLLDRVESVISEVQEIVAEARVAGAAGLRLQAIDRLERLLRLPGQVSGELKPDGQIQVVNLMSSPDWLAMRSQLMAALEAREAVARALSLPTPAQGYLGEATAPPGTVIATLGV